MTINQYLNKIPPDERDENGDLMRNVMGDLVHIWTNATCYGYCVKAMRMAGLSEKQISDTVEQLRFVTHSNMDEDDAMRYFAKYEGITIT